MTTAWKKVWREGIAPQLSTPGLTALAKALREDDPKLLQGATCSPPPLQCVEGWDTEAADAIGYTFICHPDGKWRPVHVGKVEGFFGKVCYDCDILLGESASARWFINFYDDTPRDEMRRCLLPEVQRVLAFRAACDRFGFTYDTPFGLVTDRLEDEGDVLALNEVEAGSE